MICPKFILFSFLILSLSSIAQAQDPPFFNSNGGWGGNVFPLNHNSFNKVQWVYDANSFPGAPAGTIDTLWIHVSSTDPGVFTSGFSISLGQSAAYGSWTSSNFETGLTVVYAPGAVTTAAPINGWVPFALSSPFSYDPSLPLVLEIKQSSFTTGLNIQQVSYPPNNHRRIYGSYSSTSGTRNSALLDLGLSISSTLLSNYLLKFDATPIHNKTVQLNWSIEQEHPIQLFTVENSPNGIDWTPIKDQTFIGKYNYQTLHLDPLLGDSYYRLKLTTHDGIVYYSPIKAVRIAPSNSSKLLISPNPVATTFRVESKVLDTKNWSLWTVLGKEVPLSFVSRKRHSIVIDCTHLNAGIYLLKTSFGTHKIQKL